MCWLLGFGALQGSGLGMEPGREGEVDGPVLFGQGEELWCRECHKCVGRRTQWSLTTTQHWVRPAVAFSVPFRDTGFIIFHPDNDQYLPKMPLENPAQSLAVPLCS